MVLSFKVCGVREYVTERLGYDAPRLLINIAVNDAIKHIALLNRPSQYLCSYLSYILCVSLGECMCMQVHLYVFIYLCYFIIKSYM